MGSTNMFVPIHDSSAYDPMAGDESNSDQPEHMSTDERQQPDAVSNLRPLAPKPRPPPRPPLPSKSSSARGLPEQAAGSSKRSRRNPAICSVCYRSGCQLPTHIASHRLSHPTKSVSPVKPSDTSPKPDLAFSSSYAYQAAQNYANPGRVLVPGEEVLEYKFPLGPEMNTPEKRRLFHQWFTVEARDAYRIPRPPDLVGDIIVSPFMLPALRDPLLCLAVLAGAEAGESLLAGHQTPSVPSFTLLDHAIQQLRERIQADPNISDMTIVAAAFLWVTSIFLEDVEAMKSYGETVFALVEARQGLSELGMVGAVERLVRWTDAISGFLLNTPCRFHEAPDPGLPFKLPDIQYGSYWSRANKNTTIKVDDAVRSLCQDVCRELEILEHLEAEGVAVNDYTRYIDRMCVLYNRESFLRSQTYDSGPVNQCIIIAASLLHFHCLQDWKYFMAGGSRTIASLATAIRNTGGPIFWQADLDLLTWLVFAVVVVPIDSEEKSWCFSFLCRVIVTRFSNHGDAIPMGWKEDLKTSLQQFIWCDLRLDGQFHEVCLKVEDELRSDEEDGIDGDDD